MRTAAGAARSVFGWYPTDRSVGEAGWQESFPFGRGALEAASDLPWERVRHWARERRGNPVEPNGVARTMSETATRTSEAPGAPPLPASGSGRALPALAGAVAAGVALGVGELASSAGGADHTLITSVGTSFIDRFAGSLKELAVALFGANDKTALVVGIVVVSLALGALAGIRRQRHPWFPWALFLGFGVVGILASATDELASTGASAFGALFGAVAGLVTLHFLSLVLAGGGPQLVRPLPESVSATAATNATTAGVSNAAPSAVEDPRRKHASRRAFFGWAGAGSALALVTAAGSRKVGSNSEVERARASVTLPPATNGGAARTGGTTTTLEPVAGPGGQMVGGLSPYITPNDDFYKIDTALVTPNVDIRTWTLAFTGLVDNPFEITFDELVAMADTEETVTIACVSNEVGDDLVGNARWQGVPLRKLLERAGVRPEAGQIIGESVDGFTAGFPVGALDGDRVALVAVGMNGEPLPVDHGFPARLIIAGLYGYVSATKWLSEVRLTTWEGESGYWMPRGWSKLGPIKTQSRIDVPRSGASIAPGPTPVAGVAWAPTKGITKVEVQVDDGPWIEADLGDVVSDNTWCQWVTSWDATPGEHHVRVRATDGTGEVQTEREMPTVPDGATGWHQRRVRVADR